MRQLVAQPETIKQAIMSTQDSLIQILTGRSQLYQYNGFNKNEEIGDSKQRLKMLKSLLAHEQKN